MRTYTRLRHIIRQQMLLVGVIAFILGFAAGLAAGSYAARAIQLRYQQEISQ